MSPKTPDELEQDREIEAEASDLLETGANHATAKRIVSKMSREQLEDTVHHQIEAASKFQREFRKHLATLLVTAFGFAAALFWQNAIVEALNTVMPTSGWIGKLITAILVTVLAVLALWFITKYIGQPGEKWW